MRDPVLRLNDFYEVYEQPDPNEVRAESERCMNCGAAFCMPDGGYLGNDGVAAGCPINNRIPEWNALAQRGRWRDAYDRLALTNNFPEFTSRVCPAPCQDACIVGIHDRPVAIKSIERAIIDRAMDEQWIKPRTPATRTNRRIAIIGSGPAGLAAADELNAQGHHVTIYERNDQPGGLLMYGIPNMKLDKDVLRMRIDLMQQAGITFQTNTDVGCDLDPQRLVHDHDALVLATGALAPRDLSQLPGRHLTGVVQALPYLEHATRHVLHDTPMPEVMNARDKHVVIIGGGDTGADCIATALRQRARSVTNITRRDTPPSQRDKHHPWPGPTGSYVIDYAHDESVARHGQSPRTFAIQPVAFHPSTYPRTCPRTPPLAHSLASPHTHTPNGPHVGSIEIRHLHNNKSARTETIPADLIILAIGFTGSDSPSLLTRLGFVDGDPTQMPPPAKIHTAGDLRSGPSLVVNAIAQGRDVANTITQSLKTSPPGLEPGTSWTRTRRSTN